jgi:hypothetical protein
MGFQLSLQDDSDHLEMCGCTESLKVFRFQAGKFPFQFLGLLRQLDIFFINESINGDPGFVGMDVLQLLLHSGTLLLISLALLLHFTQELI